MAKKMTLDDALKRMCKYSLNDMAAVSNFEKCTISRLRSGVLPGKRFEKYINLLNYLYYDNREEN